MLTHQLSIDASRQEVTKRFVQSGRGEPDREWRALRLLAVHAPGLGPAPVSADLTASPPVIRMSFLPGQQLRGRSLTSGPLDGLARALSTLWNAVPLGEVRPVPGEAPAPEQVLAAIGGLTGVPFDAGAGQLVRQAHACGLEWLRFATAPGGPFAAGAAAGPGQVPVFGSGDANLANFLWDGERVRIVDFEDSGHSDRAFELAGLVEHISAWHDSGLDADAFCARFALGQAEQRRLLECRRLAAVHWLLLLRPGSRSFARNPPGTLQRQAARLLGLVG